MILRYQINEEIRIKDFLKKEHYPSNIITKIQSIGQYLVNDQTVSNWYLMKPGDLLEVVIPATLSGKNITSVKGDLDIVYEDSYLLIVNKPNNLATIPTREHFDKSLANYVMSYYKRVGIVANIHFVGRLDAPTSGLIMLAKNSLVLTLLKKSTIIKKYLLETSKIVTPPSGIIESGIVRDEESIIKRKNVDDLINSKTIYETKEVNSQTSIIEATLCTGKTHQLRLHFLKLGCPIVGDELYGEKSEDGILHLHSSYLSFVHPVTQERLTFTSFPDWYQNKPAN